MICSAERGVYFIETHLETMAAEEYMAAAKLRVFIGVSGPQRNMLILQ